MYIGGAIPYLPLLMSYHVEFHEPMLLSVANIK